MRLASISVDLDEIPNYYAIHGLSEPTDSSASLVYDVALSRLQALADEGGFPMTLFAIGADMEREQARDNLRAAAKAGHEIGNHTLDHRYDFVRLGRDEIERQISMGARVLGESTGQVPVGFRAPGYTITNEVFDILADHGAAYDASVFPCPPYYLAKAAAMGAMAARGRTSRSILDSPEVLFAPTRPYRVGRPYWWRGEGLLEIPVQVTRGLRLPFIGTSVTMAGPSRARMMTRMCIGERLVNLELHGIDVLDTSDGLDALRPHQPGIAIPHARKAAAILSVVDELKHAGYTFVTMREAAEAFA